MFAGAPPADLRRPALQPGEVIRARAVLRETGARVGQGAKTEEARSALSRALACEVAHDPRGLAHGTSTRRQDPDYAAPQATAVSQGQPHRLLRSHPAAEVATDQDSAWRFGHTAGYRVGLADGR